MKALRRICAMLALTLVLAISVFAGDIQIGVTAPPPPPQNATTTGDLETGVTGEMSTTAAGQMDTGATEVTLSLLQSVLSLF